jgi:hypothetical protein
MHMRNDKYDDNTNRIGFRMQCGAGLLSLAMNVYAAHNLFGILFGIAIVGLFILSEWARGKIRLRVDAKAAEAAADAKRKADEAQAIVDAANAWMSRCAHPTRCMSEPQCATKTAAAAKRSKTVARKARLHAQQTKALDSLLVNA